MDSNLSDVLGAFAPVSLHELDQRAALLRRVDRISLSKYLVGISLVDTARGEPQPGSDLFE